MNKVEIQKILPEEIETAWKPIISNSRFETPFIEEWYLNIVGYTGVRYVLHINNIPTVACVVPRSLQHGGVYGGYSTLRSLSGLLIYN